MLFYFYFAQLSFNFVHVGSSRDVSRKVVSNVLENAGRAWVSRSNFEDTWCENSVLKYRFIIKHKYQFKYPFAELSRFINSTLIKGRTWEFSSRLPRVYTVSAPLIWNRSLYNPLDSYNFFYNSPSSIVLLSMNVPELTVFHHFCFHFINFHMAVTNIVCEFHCNSLWYLQHMCTAKANPLKIALFTLCSFMKFSFPMLIFFIQNDLFCSTSQQRNNTRKITIC